NPEVFMPSGASARAAEGSLTSGAGKRPRANAKRRPGGRLWKPEKNRSEFERLGLLDAFEPGDLVELFIGQRAVDGDKRDGVAANIGTAEIEIGDIDAQRAEQGAEAADMARLVLVGDIEHGRRQFGLH